MKKLLIATAIVVGFSGNGLSLDKTCSDCYKCVEYIGLSCARCEYDVNYCAVEHAACNSDEECPDGMRCNDMGICEYFALLDECQDGEFLSDEGCAPCPEFGDTVTFCSPHSMYGGMAGITSCYYSSGCQFSDKTGTFVLTGNCEYSLKDSVVGDVEFLRP